MPKGPIVEPLPDVLTALDLALQDEIRTAGQGRGATDSPLPPGLLAQIAENFKEKSSTANSKQPESDGDWNSGSIMDHLVFLRAEAIPEHQMKGITVMQFVGQVLAVILLVVEVAFKFLASDAGYVHSKATEWWNVVTSGLCLLAIALSLFVFCKKAYSYRKRAWGRRRAYMCILTMSEAFVMTVNCIFMIIPNIHVLVKDCTWDSALVKVSAYIKFSCWNVLCMIFLVHGRNANFWVKKGEVVKHHGKDQAILDAPVWVHLPVLVHWTIFESVNIALLALSFSSYEDRFKRQRDKPGASSCESFSYSCRVKPASLALETALFSSWLVWVLLWARYVYKALGELQKRPWQRYRMANTNIRIQVKTRANSLIILIISVPLLCFAKINSCATYTQTYLGMGPLLLIETVSVLSNLYFYMPITPALWETMRQVMLQEFAWTEAQAEERLQMRNFTMKALGFDGCDQPMYCFESTIKAFYFSALIYQYEDEKEAARAKRNRKPDPTVQGYTLTQAMELYNLERFELLVEPAEDTKVLLCWNADTIVLTFRGTASLANVIGDLQVWTHPHPPKRGTYFHRPEVHAGFLKAWMANGLHKRVIRRLHSIVDTPGVNVDNLRVFFTGHSLGGALANLAAFDVAGEFEGVLKSSQIVCITFGAPRTGNHCYAIEYNRLVPETWGIINSRDIIPKAGKFVNKYKRPGLRVIITRIGDMLVRPTFVEFSATQSLPFQASVIEHQLTSYRESLLAVCAAHSAKKGFRASREDEEGLINSREIENTLSPGKTAKKRKRQRLVEDLGGFSIVQMAANIKRNVGNMIVNWKGSKQDLRTVAGETAAESGNTGTLRCHDGVRWREGDDAHDTSTSSPDTKVNKNSESAECLFGMDCSRISTQNCKNHRPTDSLRQKLTSNSQPSLQTGDRLGKGRSGPSLQRFSLLIANPAGDRIRMGNATYSQSSGRSRTPYTSRGSWDDCERGLQASDPSEEEEEDHHLSEEIKRFITALDLEPPSSRAKAVNGGDEDGSRDTGFQSRQSHDGSSTGLVEDRTGVERSSPVSSRIESQSQSRLHRWLQQLRKPQELERGQSRKRSIEPSHELGEGKASRRSKSDVGPRKHACKDNSQRMEDIGQCAGKAKSDTDDKPDEQKLLKSRSSAHDKQPHDEEVVITDSRRFKVERSSESVVYDAYRAKQLLQSLGLASESLSKSPS